MANKVMSWSSVSAFKAAMGCSASVTHVTYQPTIVLKNLSRRNAEIEKELQKWRLMRSRQVKLILLGAAESGKSTILKQMR